MPGGTNREVTTTFRVDISNLRQNIQTANRSIREANSEFRAASGGMDDFAQSEQGLRAKIRQLNTILDSQRSVLDDYETELDRVVEEQGEESDAATEMRIRINNLRGSIAQNENALARYEDRLDNVGDSEEEAADGADSASESTTNLGSVASSVAKGALAALGAAIAAVGAGLVAAIKQTDEAKGALNNFAAATGTAKEDLTEYKDVLDEIYSNNFGESFDDVADAMSKVKQVAGDIDPTNLEKLTTNAILLRDTFEMEVPESMRAVNSLMDQFGLTGEAAYNLIAQGAQNGLNQNDDLLDTINEYSVQYAKLGFSAEDMFNSLASGVNTGTWSVDKLGDAVKEFSIRSIDGSDTTIAGFKALGLNAKKTMKTFAKGGDDANAAFEDVVERLVAMEDPVKRDLAGVNLFGTMWEDLGVEAVGSLDDIDGSISTTNTALNDINNVKYDTLGEAITGVGRKLQTDFIAPIGESATPAFQTFADDISKGVNDADGNLSTLTESVGSAVGSLIANLGTMIISALPTVVSTGKDIVEGIATSLSENGPTLVSTGQELLTTLFNGIMTGIPKLFTFGSQMMTDLGESVRENLPSFAETALDAVEGFVDMLGENLPKLIEGGISMIQNLAQGLMDALPTLIERVPTIVSKIAGLINDNAPKVLMAGINLIKTIALGLIKAIPVLIKNIPKILKAIFDAWLAFNWLKLGKTIIVGIKNGIMSMVGAIKRASSGIGEKIITALKNLPGKLLELGRGAVRGIGNAFRNNANNVGAAAREIFTLVVSKISALPAKLLELGRNAMTNLASKFTGAIPTIKTKAKEIFDTVVDKIKEMPASMLKIGTDIVTGLWNGIGDKVSWLKEKITGFAKGALDAIKDFFGIHSPSRVMRMEVGRYLPEGMAQGIDDGADEVYDKMKKLGKNSLALAKGAISSNLGGISIGGTTAAKTSAATTGEVTNNYNFTQTNNSPKALSRAEIYRQTNNQFARLKKTGVVVA